MEPSSGWRSKGNELFLEGDMAGAASCYEKAIEALSHSNGPSREDAASLFCNLSVAHLRQGLGAEALLDAESSIRICPKFAKGHYRKAQALMMMKSFNEALASAEMANVLAPNSDAKMFMTVIRKASEGPHVVVPAQGPPFQATASIDPTSSLRCEFLERFGFHIFAQRDPSSSEMTNDRASLLLSAPDGTRTRVTGDFFLFREAGAHLPVSDILAYADLVEWILSECREEASFPQIELSRLREWQFSYNMLLEQQNPSACPVNYF